MGHFFRKWFAVFKPWVSRMTEAQTPWFDLEGRLKCSDTNRWTVWSLAGRLYATKTVIPYNERARLYTGWGP